MLPAYDPDANRIEWLWRVPRRVVTHNHRRSSFELLLADLEQHFLTLAQPPAELLRHIDSPFAPDKDQQLLCLSLRPHNHLGSIADQFITLKRCRHLLLKHKDSNVVYYC